MTEMINKPEHTPGPWWYEDRGGHLPRRIVSQKVLVCFFDSVTSEADSRLIAAAPKLLEQLEVAVLIIEDAARHYKDWPEALAYTKDMRAVIKAAKGESDD